MSSLPTKTNIWLIVEYPTRLRSNLNRGHDFKYTTDDTFDSFIDKSNVQPHYVDGWYFTRKDAKDALYELQKCKLKSLNENPSIRKNSKLWRANVVYIHDAFGIVNLQSYIDDKFTKIQMWAEKYVDQNSPKYF